MSVSQIQLRAGAAEDHAGLAVVGQDRPAAGGWAGARPVWRRLCPSSFVLAGVTVVLVWAGVAELLRQGRLESVLRGGWAELAAPVLVALVVAAGLCERIWPAEPRPVQNWPGWLLIPLTVVAMDAANWLAHFADHRLGFLWRFHALHHSQEELSVLTSFRAHPLMHTAGFVLATVPVEQGEAATPGPLLLAGQLIEPFQAQH